MTVTMSVYLLGVVLLLVARRQPLARTFDAAVARRLINAQDPDREDVLVVEDEGVEEARQWLDSRRDTT